MERPTRRPNARRAISPPPATAIQVRRVTGKSSGNASCWNSPKISRTVGIIASRAAPASSRHSPPACSRRTECSAATRRVSPIAAIHSQRKGTGSAADRSLKGDPSTEDSIQGGLLAERERFPVERETLFVQRETLFVERERLFAQRKGSPVERETLFAWRETLFVRRETLFVERERLFVEQEGSLVERERAGRHP